MNPTFVIVGAINGAYVEQGLVPTLAASEIVVMVNLPAHKAANVRDAIEKPRART